MFEFVPEGARSAMAEQAAWDMFPEGDGPEREDDVEEAHEIVSTAQYEDDDEPQGEPVVILDYSYRTPAEMARAMAEEAQALGARVDDLLSELDIHDSGEAGEDLDSDDAVYEIQDDINDRLADAGYEAESDGNSWIVRKTAAKVAVQHFEPGDEAMVTWEHDPNDGPAGVSFVGATGTVSSVESNNQGVQMVYLDPLVLENGNDSLGGMGFWADELEKLSSAERPVAWKEANLTARHKAEIRKRDGHTCQRCGAKFSNALDQLYYENGVAPRKTSSPMPVHHIDGDSRNNDPLNLCCLCKSCNRIEPRLRDEWGPALAAKVARKYGLRPNVVNQPRFTSDEENTCKSRESASVKRSGQNFSPEVTRRRAMAKRAQFDDEQDEEDYYTEYGFNPNEPSEGDYVISDSGPLGSMTSVSQGTRFLGEYASEEEALAAIREDMEREQFWPGVWRQDDHGGMTPVTAGKAEDPGVEAARKSLERFDREKSMSLNGHAVTRGHTAKTARAFTISRRGTSWIAQSDFGPHSYNFSAEQFPELFAMADEDATAFVKDAVLALDATAEVVAALMGGAVDGNPEWWNKAARKRAQCRTAQAVPDDVRERLEYLRSQIQSERISYEEIAELQSLADYIEDGDAELLEWAGVDEGDREAGKAAQAAGQSDYDVGYDKGLADLEDDAACDIDEDELAEDGIGDVDAYIRGYEDAVNGRPKSARRKRAKYWLGHKDGGSVVFESEEEPQKDVWGGTFDFVDGPFETVESAIDANEYAYNRIPTNIWENVATGEFEVTEDYVAPRGASKIVPYDWASDGFEKSADYQGWTNYETWNAVLWVQNDEAAYNEMVAGRPYAADSARALLEGLFPGGTPDMDGPQDYDKVEWQEVADAFNEE